METFLTALREPLLTTLAVVDLTGKPIEDIISWVLRLDRAEGMSMTTLERALPTEEETCFRQAVQCTTCLNPGYSSMECTLRSHCMICHSRAHTLELCEYNLLNRNTTSVRQIEPQPNKTQSDDFPRYRDWDDHYRRDNDYRRDEDYRRGNDYNRNDNYRRGDDYLRDADYNWDEDYRRNDTN